MMFGSAPVNVPLAVLEATAAADRYADTTICESGGMTVKLTVCANTLPNAASNPPHTNVKLLSDDSATRQRDLKNVIIIKSRSCSNDEKHFRLILYVAGTQPRSPTQWEVTADVRNLIIETH